ncbi:MAG: arginine N-succinyltransferase, partial [Parachlamydiaceae bacterium]
MTFIRPVERKDSDRIIELAFKAQFGITSLPKNREALLDKIEQSIASFSKQVEKPGPERYLFVLEELETGIVMGVSGIKADTSIDHPLTSYHIVNEGDHFWLVPSIKFSHLTEISSLFVDRPYRKQGVGRLLSFSRFL